MKLTKASKTALTGLVLTVFALPAFATGQKGLIVLAQADGTSEVETVEVLDPVAQAEQEVEDARAALRAAMSGAGGNVREARRQLRRALARLEQAQANPDQPLPPLEGEQSEAAQSVEIPAVEQEVTAPAVPVQPVQPLQPAEPVESATTQQPVQPPQLPQLPEQQAQQPEATTTEQAIVVAPEAGDEVVAPAQSDGRVIVRRRGQLSVLSDDSDRLEQGGGQAQVRRGRNGRTITTVVRPNGNKIVTTRSRSGEVVERYREGRNGRRTYLIGGPQVAQPKQNEPIINFQLALPKLEIRIPEQEYVVESERASDQLIEQALIAPPVEQVERAYSLREIRESGRLRNKLRRIDLDTVTFEFGSAAIPGDQIGRMQRIGESLNDVIRRNPGEVFLIEGHTDAVGSDLSNLALSDRRAESVASVLTAYFAIPPENLVTQGYGEQFLKILTAGPERQNRRVTLRRITPLLRGFDG